MYDKLTNAAKLKEDIFKLVPLLLSLLSERTALLAK